MRVLIFRREVRVAPVKAAANASEHQRRVRFVAHAAARDVSESLARGGQPAESRDNMSTHMAKRRSDDLRHE
jgi:hypothetical protein